MIAFGDEFCNEDGADNKVAEETYRADHVDLIMACPEEKVTTARLAEEPPTSDILVDLSTVYSEETQESSKVLPMESSSDDLAVLITAFPIPVENEENVTNPEEAQIFRNTFDIVQLVSKGFLLLIEKRFESADKKLIQMQPLYDIGPAIRK